jgi:hypothetical protein
VAAAYWRHWKREHEEQEDKTQSTTNTPSHQQQRPTSGRRTVIPSNSVTNQSTHYERKRQDPIEKSNDDNGHDSNYIDNGLPIEEVDRR